MSRLDTLRSIVPDLLDSMKSLYKADQSDYYLRALDLTSLISRIKSAYSKEIAEAGFLVAHVRFRRWSKDYDYKMRIESFLREVSE